MPEETRRMLVGAIGGDDAARSQLLERVRPRLLLWVTARTSPALRSKVEPEDLVQDILLAVHKSLGQFQGDDDRAFVRWLFTVAENRIRDSVDHFGAKKRQEAQIPGQSEQTTPSEGAHRNEMAEKVRKALTSLSEPHRRVIQLRRFEERDVAEIAQAMDRSQNAVRVLYCRAVQALREEMGEA